MGATLTFLAVVRGPAPVVVLIVDGGLLAQGLLLHCPRTQVPALLRGLVTHDVVVGRRVQDQRPVHCGQVAEVGILLDPDGPPRDVPQVVEPDVFEAGSSSKSCSLTGSWSSAEAGQGVGVAMAWDRPGSRSLQDPLTPACAPVWP